MARPTTLTPELQEAIAACRAPTLDATLMVLHAQGHLISKRTLQRHRAKTPKHMRPEPVAAAVLIRADEALEGDELGPLRASVRELSAAKGQWAPYLGQDRFAVRAYLPIVEKVEKLIIRIKQLTPRPPDTAADPANVAAKARLLAMVAEILARAP